MTNRKRHTRNFPRNGDIRKNPLEQIPSFQSFHLRRRIPELEGTSWAILTLCEHCRNSKKYDQDNHQPACELRFSTWNDRRDGSGEGHTTISRDDHTLVAVSDSGKLTMLSGHYGGDSYSSWLTDLRDEFGSVPSAMAYLSQVTNRFQENAVCAECESERWSGREKEVAA